MSGKIITAKEIAKKLIGRQRGIQLDLSTRTPSVPLRRMSIFGKQKVKSRRRIAENSDLRQGQASEIFCC